MEPQKTPPASTNNNQDLPKSATNLNSQATNPVNEAPVDTGFAGSKPVEPQINDNPESNLPPASETEMPPSLVAGSTLKPDSATPSDVGSGLAPQDDSGVSTTDPTLNQQDKPFPDIGESSAPIAVDPLPVSSHHGKKKGLMLGLVATAVFLLLSGGAAASYYYVVNKPENILKQALANAIDFNKTKTFQFSGAVNIDSKDSDMSLESTYSGTVDNKTGAFDVSGKADVFVTNVTFDFRSPDSKTYYARVGGLEGLSELLAATGDTGAMYAPAIKAVNDQWIEINESLLKQVDKSYKGGTTTDNDNKKLAQAYLDHSFLVVKESLASEAINGKDSYHYKIVADPAKLKDFLNAVKNAKLDSYQPDQKALDDLNKSVNDAKLDKYPFEVWISKDDKMFTQVVFKATQDGTAVNLRLTTESYNKPVNVKKPDGAKSVLDLIGEFSTDISVDSELFPSSGSGSGISL